MKQTHYLGNLQHLDDSVPTVFVNDLLQSTEGLDGLPQLGQVRLQPTHLQVHSRDNNSNLMHDPPLSSIVKSRRLLLFWNVALMDRKADEPHQSTEDPG